ncbi:interferon regulatory factor [Elysia marginata]|uniref:Interferon regulatory factor n=1 Tax=Elysia marginata TaxID=1093978 RepID=A0AAV4GUD1_9GAST|nr:interferon regulatory factor [Elysia marginata]
MDRSPDSRLRFCPWLEQAINEGNCPGLEWVDKSQGMFKVPWYHYNRSENIRIQFKVFRDWAVYTGMHTSGDDVDYPKWKRNFRCALNKVSDISEVPELHSEKDAPSPFKVYRFLNRQSPSSNPAPEPEELWVLVEAPTANTDNLTLVSSFVPLAASSLVSSSSSDPAGDRPTTSVAPASIADDNFPASSHLKTEHNIPTVVMDSLPFLTKVLGKAEEQKAPQIFLQFEGQQPLQTQPQEEQQRQGQQFENDQQQRPKHQRKPEQLQAMPEISRMVSSDRHDAPMSLTENDVILDLSNKNSPTMIENMSPGLIDEKVQKDKEVSNLEKRSIPSDLGSVNSDDLIGAIPVVDFPNDPSSLSLEKEAKENMAFHGYPTLPQNDGVEEDGMVIKAFYGFHQQRVLERTIINSDKSCRVYFGEPKKDIPDLVERMYGPPDAFQIELPRSDICGGATPKQRDFISAILREMHRGVVLTTNQGDIYARRYCRTRAFVYDQDSQSWPLSRKINIPEKIFDFENFKTRFEMYKQNVCSGRLNCCSPIPYVYITFGHRVPLENDIQGKVLVAMTIAHRRAEQMLRWFQASVKIESVCASENRLLSSMDTMDKVIENYDSMSIE